jgi:hypothetical protein
MIAIAILIISSITGVMVCMIGMFVVWGNENLMQILEVLKEIKENDNEF